MTELIKITEQNGNRAVSARELHQFLENKDRFSKWFERMKSYGFENQTDFTGVNFITHVGNGATRKVQDYALTLDCAKEIAMLQKSEKGKQARRYFIAKEKELKELQYSTPATINNQLQDIQEKLKVLEAKSITTEVTEFTVFGFASMQRKKLYGSEAMTIGKRSAKRCKELKLPVNKIIDQRFGWVNTYPKDVLQEVFDEFFKNPRF